MFPSGAALDLCGRVERATRVRSYNRADGRQKRASASSSGAPRLPASRRRLRRQGERAITNA